MSESQKIALSPKAEEYIAEQVRAGRFQSANDVVEKSLLEMEKAEKLPILRAALEKGRNSASAPFNKDEFIKRMKHKYVK